MKKDKQNIEKIEKPVFPMRINKYLALQKHSTRRGADELIADKKVFINGRLAVLGDKVVESDKVEVKFRGAQKPYIYLAYHKPRGLTTEEINVPEVFPVGRLDKDSHGLIILTNDGRVTERLLGPTQAHEKEYLVRTKNTLRSSFKEKMEVGVQIDKDKTGKCKVKILDDHTFRIILTEGKKHQIRRMCDALFQEVQDLKRIRVVNIELGNLPIGTHCPISGLQLQTFLHSLNLA